MKRADEQQLLNSPFVSSEELGRSRRVFCQITPKKFLVLKEALKTCSYVKLVFDSASASLGDKGSVKGD